VIEDNRFFLGLSLRDCNLRRRLGVPNDSTLTRIPGRSWRKYCCWALLFVLDWLVVKINWLLFLLLWRVIHSLNQKFPIFSFDVLTHLLMCVSTPFSSWNVSRPEHGDHYITAHTMRGCSSILAVCAMYWLNSCFFVLVNGPYRHSSLSSIEMPWMLSKSLLIACRNPRVDPVQSSGFTPIARAVCGEVGVDGCLSW
jgi:hypothetical protein